MSDDGTLGGGGSEGEKGVGEGVGVGVGMERLGRWDSRAESAECLEPHYGQDGASAG